MGGWTDIGHVQCMSRHCPTKINQSAVGIGYNTILLIFSCYEADNTSTYDSFLISSSIKIQRKAKTVQTNMVA